MTRNHHEIAHQQSLSYSVLYRNADAFAGSPEFEEIHAAIDAGRVNADDTLEENPEIADAEWNRLFKSSVEGYLADTRVSDETLAFFVANGIRP